MLFEVDSEYFSLLGLGASLLFFHIIDMFNQLLLWSLVRAEKLGKDLACEDRGAQIRYGTS